MDTFKVEILSPGKLIFQGEAEKIVLPGEKGQLGILKDHAPFLTSLTKGTIRVKLAKKEERFEIESGFAEVNERGLTVLVK